jgi:hypothetical protein
MAHYFFNIHSAGQLIEDEEGMDLPDLDAAREEAAASVHDLTREEIHEGAAIDTSALIEITDPDGRVLMAVKFAEVLSRNGYAS